MEFLHPEFLYFMLPPLFILFGLLLTQKEREAVYFSDEVMNRLRVSANTLTLKARNALFFLVAILVVIALGNPVITDGTIQIKAKSADVMIALDISDSMLAEDLYPNRLDFAKQKMIELLKIAPNERIGVTAFAKNSYLVSPLSFDHGAVSFLLSQLNTTSITEKGTDFISMLQVVNNSIESKKKYLLVLSDGGDKKDFSQEIAFAKEKNIVVFILGVATQKGAPIKLKDGNFIKHKGDIIISKLNEDISSLATKTGGVYIQSVNSNADIKAMIAEITSSSEQKELKSEEIQKYIPLFYYPLGLAIFILLIATSSVNKRSKVNTTFAILFFMTLFQSQDVQAGIFDFMELDEAKVAYEKGEYKKSQKLYSDYATASNNPSSHYNNANALYKQGNFKEAINSYDKAVFEDDILNAKKYSNLGNSYAKLQEEGSLEKAKEVYEKSLALNEDKNTRENLETIEKLLEQQKEQENKDNRNKNEQEKKENKDQKKKKEEKEKEDKKSQNEQEEKEKEDKKSQNKQEEKEKEDKKSQNKQNKDTNETKPKKEDLKELDKDENNATRPQKPKEGGNQMLMSEAEAQKWLQQLNAQKNTYLYRLNQQKEQKQDPEVKPW